MALPTDGWGLYEGANINRGASVTQPRLDAIAAGGFKLIMNYGLLHGHMTDMITYINYAATKGLKIIVALHDPRIWRDNTYAAAYPELYADSGNAGTGTAFMQYIVAQTKALAGVWGWYVGDEVVNSDHSTFKTYCDAVKAADATHPRLCIEGGVGGTNSVASGTNLMYDCCDVLGDDYYPYGAIAPTYTLAQQSARVQSFDEFHNLSSAMVLQAQSIANYGQYGAPWPTEAQMISDRNTVVNNMSPRLVLWFEYSDIINDPAVQYPPPALQWTYVQAARQGKSGLVQFPAATRRGSPSTTNYVTNTLAKTPFAYYRLNELAGNYAGDSSGNGYHGTLVGTITQGQPGVIVSPADTAMLFDGSTGYITLPSGASGAGLSAISVEAWINLSSTSYSFASIFDSGAAGSNHAGVNLYLSTSSAAFAVGNGTSDASNSLALPNYGAGVWYHLVGTYDGTQILLFVNAVPKIGGIAQSGTVGTSGLIPRIGATTSTSLRFPGLIAQVALYPSALTQAQISNQYRAGLGLLQSTTILFSAATRRQS